MIDEVEKQKRIYQVSLLLRRKPISFIIEYIRKEWGIEKAQAYNYIKEARNEWIKYFKNIKGAGIGYHVAQIRDLKDLAFNEKDTRLILEIIKEEAKLMGIYPANKIEGDLNVRHEIIVDMPEGENEDNSQSEESK